MKIFISSPGDVAKERRTAERLIERLVKEYQNRASIEAYFWEYEPMRHDRTFQDQIPATSDFDLVICILWSRLGTPLRGPDGREYASGTEYEVLSAQEPRADGGKPDVWIYRNMTPAQIRQLPASERRRLYAQLEALDEFVSKYCVDPESGVIKGAYTSYQDLGSFEIKLEKHLRKLIETKYPSASVSLSAMPAPIWRQGSPFRGLEIFDFVHAPIFFGRTRAIGDVLGLLRKRMTEVQDALSVSVDEMSIKPATFVLISAMSGVGKSSLVRAGVLPILVQPGDGVALWRRAVMRPGEASKSLFDGLARALCRSEALPELLGGEATIESIAAIFRRNPAGIEFGLSAALDHASGLLRQEEMQSIKQRQEECRQLGRIHDEQRATQLLEVVRTAKKPARLVLVIDQLEELFTLESISREERSGFVSALAALARSGKVYVIATLRADFFARCADIPLLVELSREQGLYYLTPPTPEEISQIIRCPAQAAGIRFEIDTKTGQDMAERLRDAAVRNPEAVPLLEFCLEELYRLQATRNDGWLRHADYEAMGGLEGALRRRAEIIFASLKPQEKLQFGHVVRAVSTVALDQAGVFNRRWADYDDLVVAEGAKEMVEAFLAADARLFVADLDDGGRKVVSVAHEALFSAWVMLKEWLETNRENLQIRATLSAEAKRWRESGLNSDYLCPTGLPLEKAKQVQREGFLNRDENAFVQASFALAEASARRKVRNLRRWLAAVGLLALLAMINLWFSWHNERVAVAEKQHTISALSRSDFFRAVDLIKEGKNPAALAYLARALRLDPHNHGAFVRLYTLLISQHRWPLPLSKPMVHDSEVCGAHFSPDGSEVDTVSKRTLYKWNARTGEAIGKPISTGGRLGDYSNFSRDGKSLVVSTKNEDQLWDISLGQPIGVPIRSPDPTGREALSPDGTRLFTCSMQTGRLGNAVSGQAIGSPMQIGSIVIFARFSPDGSQLLTSSTDYFRLWDGNTGQPVGAPVHEGSFVVSATYSPDGRKLAAILTDHTVRILDSQTLKQVGAALVQGEHIFNANFSSDSKRIVTASGDNMARLWDADTGLPLGDPMRHGDEVHSASFSPDGKRIVTASWDKTARIWDGLTAFPLSDSLQCEARLSSADFDPTGNVIITTAENNTTKLWDASVSKTGEEIIPCGDKIRSASLSPDSSRIAIVSDQDNAAQMWDAHTFQPVGQPMRHEDYICDLEFNADGSRLVTASADKTVRQWDGRTGRPIGNPLGRQDYLWAASYSPDGNSLISRTAETVLLWNAQTGKAIGQPIKTGASVNCASFSPDGARVLTGSDDKTVRLWDCHTGQPIGAPARFTDRVYFAKYDASGSRVLLATVDKTVQIWNGDLTKLIGKIIHLPHDTDFCYFSPDGSKVLAEIIDSLDEIDVGDMEGGKVCQWDVQTSQLSGEAISYSRHLNDASYSPDGLEIITASADSTVCIWDANSAQPVAEPLGDAKGGMTAQFYPDGSRILTLSGGVFGNSSVHVWKILPPSGSEPPPWLLDLAEAVGGEKLTDGSLVPVDPDKLFELKARLATAPGDDFWSKTGRWFFSDPATRKDNP